MSASPIQLPETVDELKEIVARVRALLVSSGDDLVAVPANQRNIENTLLKLQEAQSQAAAMQTQCTFPSMVPFSPGLALTCLVCGCARGRMRISSEPCPQMITSWGTPFSPPLFFTRHTFRCIWTRMFVTRPQKRKRPFKRPGQRTYLFTSFHAGLGLSRRKKKQHEHRCQIRIAKTDTTNILSCPSPLSGLSLYSRRV